MSQDLYQLNGKRALVIGGATGMGAAAAQLAAELGASLTVLDVADVSFACESSHKVDLRSKDSVDAVISALDGAFDVVFSCAGVAQGTPGIMLINFISQRYIIDTLVSRKQLNAGGSVVMISSVAGVSWQTNLDKVMDFLSQSEWETAAAWIAEHEGTDDYAFSKQAINAFVAHQSYHFLKNGLRINAVMPGPTDTPLARANADTWLGFGHAFREDLGLSPLSPEQIAQTMNFLVSNAASGVNGVTLTVDYGHIPSSLTDAFDDPIVKYVYGVTSGN